MKHREIFPHLLANILYISVLSLLLDGSSCPTDWHYNNSNCFRAFTDTEVDPRTAREQCQNENADLASISDASEMYFVASIS